MLRSSQNRVKLALFKLVGAKRYLQVGRIFCLHFQLSCNRRLMFPTYNSKKSHKHELICDCESTALCWLFDSRFYSQIVINFAYTTCASASPAVYCIKKPVTQAATRVPTNGDCIRILNFDKYFHCMGFGKKESN